ncbi:YhcN/YlaJ family sporulation lipoprotein [Paenibacillus sp. CC-CFT747]|nr:YhcN/YlaJ family sporulation lipoprotein [Paenibacillus sp. CC-CFT747]
MKPLKPILVGFAALMVLSACTPTVKNGAPSAKSPMNGTRILSQDPAIANEDPRQTASRLEELASRLPNVQGVNCVVVGNTAIVGINVPPTLDRAQVDTVKYTVAEALKKDPRGVNALVTADLDLNQRIREMRTDVQNGRPVAGFAEELGDLIGRIMPQFPRDVQSRGNIPQ